MKIFLLIIGLILLVVGISALCGYTDYMHLPFTLEGAGQNSFGFLALVGAALFLVLSTEVKKKKPEEKVN